MVGLALSMASAMLLPALGGYGPLRSVLLGLVVLGAIGALAGAVFERRGRDRYDLAALQEIHEREEIRALLDDEPVVEADEILCRGCGEVYPARLPACPRCKLPSGG